MIFDDVSKLNINGFMTTPASGGVPPLVLTDVQDAWITGASAPTNSSSLARIDGRDTRSILFTGCDARAAEQLAVISSVVRAAAVRGEFNVARE